MNEQQQKPIFGTLGAIQVKIPTPEILKLSAALVIVGLILIFSHSFIKKI